MRFSLLCLLVLLVPGALAQTVPVMDPYEPGLRRCFQQLMSDASASLSEADKLLAAPALPPIPELRASICRGHALIALARPAEAETQVAGVLSLLERHPFPEPEVLAALSGIGGMLQQMGHYQRAFEIFDRTYAMAKASNSDNAQIGALVNIGLVYAVGMNDPARSLPYFRKAAELAERRGGWLPRDVVMLYGYGYTLLKLEQYDEAMAVFDKVLALSKPLPDQEMTVYRTNSHRGEILRQTGKVDEGRQLLEASAAWQRERPDPQGEAVTLVRLADMHLRAGEADQALPLAQRALTLSESGRYQAEILDSLTLLSKVHAALGQMDQALAVSQKAHALEVENIRRQSLNRIGEAQAELQEVVDGKTKARTEGMARATFLRNLALGALVLTVAAGGFIIARQRRIHRALRQAGSEDPVTALSSQRQAREAMAGLSPHDSAQSAVLVLDIDDLDRINHAHGQRQGDQVLRIVADCIRQHCQDDDLVARWAGAQVLVLRQNTSEAAAQALAEQLCNAIARTPVALPGGTSLRVTASAGLAPYPLFPTDGSAQIEDSVQWAERALRMVGHNGGDGWASLWGRAAGLGTSPGGSLRKILEAQAQGLVSLGSRRPLNWGG